LLVLAHREAIAGAWHRDDVELVRVSGSAGPVPDDRNERDVAVAGEDRLNVASCSGILDLRWSEVGRCEALVVVPGAVDVLVGA
jgi:hypothetical protein